MKVLILLLLTMVLCSSCTALPAEERAFAVALCVEKTDAWRVYGRIPTYQSDGGYMTVAGVGASLAEALSDMDAAAPMRINLSQLRMLVLDAKLAVEHDVSSILQELFSCADVRMQCAVALTDAPVQQVAEALVPAAGTRLSKALDLMVDARVEQGVILSARAADVLRAGGRQATILIALSLEGEQVNLSGGYTMQGTYLQPEEIALLALARGDIQRLRLELPCGYADVRDAAVSVNMSQDWTMARLELTATVAAASCTSDEVEQALADEMLALLTRLSGLGCDALGLGRQVVSHTHELADWHEQEWLQTYRGIRWEVAVGVVGPA